MYRIDALNFLLLAFFYVIFLKPSFSQVITSSQDGGWVDSMCWNGHAMGYSAIGDTLIIRNHLTYSNDLELSNCYIRLDSGGSVCGYSNLHLTQTLLLQDGGDFYGKFLFLETSQWLGNDGYLQFIDGAKVWGEGSEMLLHAIEENDTIGGYFGGGFVCSNPVLHWKDSTLDDTTLVFPSLKIRVNTYPNPFADFYVVETELPFSNMSYELTIFDILGKKMLTQPLPCGKCSYKIISIDWNAGVYLLNINSTSESIYCQRIIHIN